MVTRIKSNNITAGSITADLLSATAISDKLGYVPANANNVSATSITSNNTSVIINDTGTNSNIEFTIDGTKALIFNGTALLPFANVTYDLGSLTKQWKDIYVGPGSLYVNGQKVLQESAGTILFTADPDQNLRVATAGDGNIELDPTGTGSILLQGPIQVQSGESISSSDGNGIKFASPIRTDTITTNSANTNLAITANGTGVVSVNDDLTITGNLTVQGSAVSLSVTSLSIEDNIIDLSAETTGTPSQNAGIRVVRGDEPAVQLRWNETTNKWQFTNDGSTYKDIADAAVGGGLSLSDDTSTNATYYPMIATTTTGNVSSGIVSSTKLTFNPSTGTLTATALTESSSIRFKENIEPIGNSLDKVLQLTGVTYDLKDKSNTKKQVGLIAEEILPFIPEVVDYDEQGNISGINYSRLTVYLIESIKELKANIDLLKGK
jgi:hypothetical protein